MRVRAEAMLKIDETMQGLSKEDQDAVAFEVWRTYGNTTGTLALLGRRRGGSSGANAPSASGANAPNEPVHRPADEPVQPRKAAKSDGSLAVQSVHSHNVVSSFLKFWSEYPRKTGKQEALRIWKRLNPNADLEARILQSVREQKTCADWCKDGGQFIPHPKTWLNQGRWDDEPMVHRSLARRLFEEGSVPNAQP